MEREQNINFQIISLKRLKVFYKSEFGSLLLIENKLLKNFQTVVSTLNLFYSLLKLRGPKEMPIIEILQFPLEMLKLANEFMGQEISRV